MTILSFENGLSTAPGTLEREEQAKKAAICESAYNELTEIEKEKLDKLDFALVHAEIESKSVDGTIEMNKEYVLELMRKTIELYSK